MTVRRPLVVIPAFLREPADYALLLATVRSVAHTAARQTELVVIDDGSPAAELYDDRLDAELIRKPENTGFSATVNVGLRRALEQDRDAVLLNADVVLQTPGWVSVMRHQHRLGGPGLASVVGALLLYPSGLVQHAGIFMSLLTRGLDHFYKFGPGDLPEAQVPRSCPVTGALQFIRHECLATVGLYDEAFKLGWEDVDYCIRVLLSGRECVYQPAIRALHHESAFRGRPSEKVARWQAESYLRLAVKYRDQSLAGLVPTL
jgi:GT2 family glycosyltransferase